jgi:hypothetical protein
MIFGGGQLGVSISYSFIPLSFLTFFKILQKPNFKTSLIFSLVFSLQILFDIRLAIITFASCFLYFLLNKEWDLKKISYCFVVPTITSLLLHIYWIFPLMLFPSKFLPENYSSVSAAEFFSFAKFENTLSLLHPNWPENIFGKVSFMRPEFLFIPIIAFSSLLFIRGKRKWEQQYILFFVLLALGSSFVAKGTNEPFSSIYSELFQRVPGFSLFRDSTKFYSLIALSFALLIPWTLVELSYFLNSYIRMFSKKQKYQTYTITMCSVLFVVIWSILLRGIFTNHNVFRIKQIPSDYAQLEQFITSQHEWYRTLWVPQWQRYGYTSNQNPAIGRTEIIKNASPSGVLKDLQKNNLQQHIDELGVKYLIVPYDSESEIFIRDHQFSYPEYQNTVKNLNKIPWIKKDRQFGNIVVYKTLQYQNRIFLLNPEKNSRVTFKYKSPTSYEVFVRQVKKGQQLVFSESFNDQWILKSSDKSITPIEYHNLNRYSLPKSGSYQLKLYYRPQKFVHIGLIVSLLTFVSILFYLFRDKIKK